MFSVERENVLQHVLDCVPHVSLDMPNGTSSWNEDRPLTKDAIAFMEWIF